MVAAGAASSEDRKADREEAAAPAARAAEVGLRSGGLGDFSAADAAGADLEGLAGRADDRVHRLEVGLPGALGLVVGVGDVVAYTTSLVTNIARTSHEKILRKSGSP
jgi:hypothetical protein